MCISPTAGTSRISDCMKWFCVGPNTIIVSDASTDPTYKYESLAQAIRKIQSRFRSSYRVQSISEYRPIPRRLRRALRSGPDLVSEVDKNCRDGWLIYIKPSLNQNEPRDLVNYLEESPDFPQESIADQFFSESQFESYRMLGYLITNRSSRVYCCRRGDYNEQHLLTSRRKLMDE